MTAAESLSIQHYKEELKSEFGSGSLREMYLLAIIRALESEQKARDLAAHVEDLMAEIHGLAAVVFKTSKALIESTETLERELLPALEDSQPLIELIDEFKEVIATTPQHHLREVMAKAGRDGFMKCVNFVRIGVDPNSDHADQYAETILNGKDKAATGNCREPTPVESETSTKARHQQQK